MVTKIFLYRNFIVIASINLDLDENGWIKPPVNVHCSFFHSSEHCGEWQAQPKWITSFWTRDYELETSVILMAAGRWNNSLKILLLSDSIFTYVRSCVLTMLKTGKKKKKMRERMLSQISKVESCNFPFSFFSPTECSLF